MSNFSTISALQLRSSMRWLFPFFFNSKTLYYQKLSEGAGALLNFQICTTIIFAQTMNSFTTAFKRIISATKYYLSNHIGVKSSS